jgi:hypothetical protein
MSDVDKPNDQAKLTTADEHELMSALFRQPGDPRRFLLLMGVRAGNGMIEVLFIKDRLDSLSIESKSQFLEALQKAAEYVTASMASGPGALA